MTTQMRFKLAPGDGLQKYLGAWAHMLAASDDLIDMMHTHPFIADGGSEMQFNLVFPRPRMHRVWVQFQRDGVINTVHFDVPVNEGGLSTCCFQLGLGGRTNRVHVFSAVATAPPASKVVSNHEQARRHEQHVQG